MERSMSSIFLMSLCCLIALHPATTQDPPTTPSAHHKYLRTVCYFTSWAHYRDDPVQFHPEDVDTSLCSHLIFAFAGLDKTGLHLTQLDTYQDEEMYARLTNLKREKPSLKVLLAVGGWNLGSDLFTKTVANASNIYQFAMDAMVYLRKYNCDGLDVDWEYPADRGSPAGDKTRFTELLKVLRQEFNRDTHLTNRSRLMLTAAISPAPSRIEQSYELPEIAQYLDFMNVMTYDFHGSWENTLGHHSALYSPTDDETDSIDYAINWIMNTSTPMSKLNLGLSFYGRTLNLTDPAQHGIGASVTGAGAAGPLTKQEGFLAYYEVCQLMTDHADTVTESGRLPGTQSPYVIDGSRWTGYDDAQSLREKVDYAVQSGMGGVFIWSIALDDFHGICGGGHYPLMHAIREQLHSDMIG